VNHAEELPLNVDFHFSTKREPIEPANMTDVRENRLHDAQSPAIEKPTPGGIESLNHPLRVTLHAIGPSLKDCHLPRRRVRLPQTLRPEFTRLAVGLLSHIGNLEGEVLELIVSDGSPGLGKAIEYLYPHVKHQRCWAHKLRNVADKVRYDYQKLVLAGAKRIPASATRKAAIEAFKRWRDRWINQYPQAVRCIEKDLDTLLACFDFPKEMRKHIRTTNLIERSFKEVRRRTRPIGCFNNVESCERIIYAVMIYLNARWEGKPLLQFAHNT
jgi:hypothetical protein